MAKTVRLKMGAYPPSVVLFQGQLVEADWIDVSTPEDHALGEQVFILGLVDPIRRLTTNI